MSSTPTCPGCGAKFAHSVALAMCTKCKLPDEIRDKGSRAIARWKVDQAMASRNVSRSQAKDTIASIGARKSRRPNKHGRRGVKK